MYRYNKEENQPNFMIIPSMSCPAACKYCFGPNIGPTMDTKRAEEVIEYVRKVSEELKLQKVYITFHGGEPLCAGHEVIENLISNMKNRIHNVSFSIQSNLWFLDDEYCKLFKKYDVNVGTSLDGPKEINDAQRGEGYYDKTMESIKLANKYGIDVGCIATFTSKTIHKWREVFDFFLDTNLSFSVHPSVSSIKESSDLSVSPDEYTLLIKEMMDYYLENYHDVSIGTLNQYCRGVSSGEGHVCTFKDCFGMFFAIDPNGDIFSCQRFAGQKEYSMGNISDSPSFAELVQSPAAQNFIKREMAIKEECGECDHYSYCKGGCAYNAINNSDNNSSKDPYCEAYKEFYSHIKEKLFEEMISEGNVQAIDKYGTAPKGNPLYRKGKVIELTKVDSHPMLVARNAKRILAAYELGKCNDINKVANKLVKMGISKTSESAYYSLKNLYNSLMSAKSLYKLYLHITWDCQLTCTHCYAVNNERVEMNADDVLKIIVDAKKCGFKEVVITGGEPLMHPNRTELLKQLRILRKKDDLIPIVLRSNFAMELSDDDFLMITNAFDEVVISIDGDEAYHDARRGSGTYKCTVDNIERYICWCKENQVDIPKIGISASINNDQANQKIGASLKQLAKKLGVNYKFRPILPLGRATNSGLEIQPFKGYISPLDLVESGFQPISSCGMGQNLYVEPSGEAFPCYAYHKPHSFLGNVISEGLQQIIEGEKFKNLASYNVDTNEQCKTCEYRYLCGGACRAWSGEAGQYDFDAAPIHCESLKNRAKELYSISMEYLSL
ncbi:MAG: TIGR04083 family peptide-modifying radical SAM enzyme [Eubacteriales bacterium]